MKKIAIISAALLLLSACASGGTNYNVNALDTLKPGMSRAEVIALLGKPNTDIRMPDGKTMLGWAYSRVRGFGGVNVRSVSLQFDADDKLVDTGYRMQSDPS